MLRLYLPIFGALALALLLVRLTPRHGRATSSDWLAAHAPSVSFGTALHDATVVRGVSSLDTPLWSLKWEVIFSILLPVYVLVLVRIRRWRAARVTGLLVLTGLGSILDQAALLYLPIFGIGVVMAQQISELDTAGTRFDSLRPLIKRVLFLGVLLLLITHWWAQAIVGVSSVAGWGTASLLLAVVGAALTVWIFASTGIGERVGAYSAVRWLGSRSFSLYLVHEPIVVTIAYLLGGTTNVALVLTLSVPTSLVAAELFGRTIEMPAHRLAQHVGRRIRRRGAVPYLPANQPKA
jgi:peptidoglycan/LPS O-acetylase OafA/YrhL